MVRPFENNASYLFSISSLFRRNKREDLWPTNNNRWLEQIRPTYFPGLYWQFATVNLYLKYKEVVESVGIYCFRIQENPYSFSMNISFSYLLARPILPLWKLTNAMALDQIETRSGINRNNARWLKVDFGLASFSFPRKTNQTCLLLSLDPEGRFPCPCRKDRRKSTSTSKYFQTEESRHLYPNLGLFKPPEYFLRCAPL